MENNVNIDTLLALIDDHDEEVYLAVRDKLVESGPAILPVLEYALNSSVSLLQHDRLEQIINQLKLSKLVENMALWANSEDKKLLDGWILLSMVHHPAIIAEKIELLIQKITHDIWSELNDALTSLEKVSIFNHYFFDIYHFELNAPDLFAPENCLINNLLVSRKGNLISLSTLYSIIAKRLGLPIHPIRIGQNLILGYYEPQISKEVYGEDADPYLFFINLEHKGTVLGIKELEYLVHENKESLEYVSPVNEGTLIKMLLSLLKQGYQINGDNDKLEITNKLLNKLRRF